MNGVGDLLSSIAVGGLWVLHPTLAMAFVILTSLAGAVIIVTVRPADSASAA